MERAWDNKQDYGTMGLSISTGDPTGDPITITAYGRGSGRTRPVAATPTRQQLVMCRCVK